MSVSEAFCVAGGYGSTLLAYSYDGLTWTDASSPFNLYVEGIAWNGSLWVAVASTDSTVTIATSPDGIIWTPRTNPFSVRGGKACGIAWNGSLWVAVGAGSVSISTSPDGIIWTGQGNPFNGGGNTIAWNGLRWVAGGYGSATIVTSSDGFSWVSVENPFNVVKGIAWNGSLFVAVGANEDETVQIATSPDGLIWTPTFNNPFSGGTGHAVAWNGLRWVAVGNVYSSIIATSIDGMTWTEVANPISYINGIAWNGSLWVAVGGGSVSIATSPDGIIWTPIASPNTGLQGKCVASRRLLYPPILATTGPGPTGPTGPTGAGPTGPTGAGPTGPTGPTPPTTPVCFFGDAPVLTPSGYRRMDSLRVGDLVSTPNGTIPIHSIHKKFYEASSSTNPYLIPKGLFGATQDLEISPRHKVAFNGKMVEARHLSLKKVRHTGMLTYYNLEISNENMIVAGVLVESLKALTTITISNEAFKKILDAKYGGKLTDEIKSKCRFLGYGVSVPTII
jgi:hypothetical protein